MFCVVGEAWSFSEIGESLFWEVVMSDLDIELHIRILFPGCFFQRLIEV